MFGAEGGDPWEEADELGRLDLHIVGSQGAGKSAFLWAIGQHFSGGGEVGEGLTASSSGIKFREHWEELEVRRKHVGGWRPTGYRGDEQEELELFSLRSKRSRRPKELRLVTRDLPGAAWLKLVNCWRQGAAVELDERIEDPEGRLETPEAIVLVIHAGTLGKDSQGASQSMFVCNALADCRGEDYPEERVSMAVVLTACEELCVRDELGEPWLERMGHREAERRSRAVKDLLCSTIQGFSHAIEGFEAEDIEFFAVSSWGTQGDISQPQPWRVEEPVLWLVEHAWSVRTAWARARRARKLSLAGALVSVLLAAASGILLGPTVHQVEAGMEAQASIDPFVLAADLLALPAHHIQALAEDPRYIEALHLRAWKLGHAKDVEGSRATLQWLDEADPSGYVSSRTAAAIVRDAVVSGQSAREGIAELELAASGGGDWGEFLDEGMRRELRSQACALRLGEADMTWDELEHEVIEPLEGGDELLAAIHGDWLGARLLERWEEDMESMQVSQEMSVPDQVALAERVLGVAGEEARSMVERVCVESLVGAAMGAFRKQDYDAAKDLFQPGGEIAVTVQEQFAELLRAQARTMPKSGLPNWFALACLDEVPELASLLHSELALDAISGRSMERLERLRAIDTSEAGEAQRERGGVGCDGADLRLLFGPDPDRELHWAEYRRELGGELAPEDRVRLLRRHAWVLGSGDSLAAGLEGHSEEVLRAIRAAVGGEEMGSVAELEALLSEAVERDSESAAAAIAEAIEGGGSFPNLRAVAAAFGERSDVHELMREPGLRPLAALMIENMAPWDAAKADARGSLRLMTALMPLLGEDSPQRVLALERGGVAMLARLDALDEMLGAGLDEDYRAEVPADLDLILAWGEAGKHEGAGGHRACQLLCREGFVCLKTQGVARALEVFEGAVGFDSEVCKVLLSLELEQGEPKSPLERLEARRQTCDRLEDALRSEAGREVVAEGGDVRKILHEVWLEAKRVILDGAVGMQGETAGDAEALQARVEVWASIEDWSTREQVNTSLALDELFTANRLWLAAQRVSTGDGAACLELLRRVLVKERYAASKLQELAEELRVARGEVDWVQICQQALPMRKEALDAFEGSPLWHLGVHAFLKSLAEDPENLLKLRNHLANLRLDEVIEHPSWSLGDGGLQLLIGGLDASAVALSAIWAQESSQNTLNLILSNLVAFHSQGELWSDRAWAKLRPGVEAFLHDPQRNETERTAVRRSLGEFGCGGSEPREPDEFLRLIWSELAADAPLIAILWSELLKEATAGAVDTRELQRFLDKVVDYELRLVVPKPESALPPFMAMVDEVSYEDYEAFHAGLVANGQRWARRKEELRLPSEHPMDGEELKRRPKMTSLALKDLEQKWAVRFQKGAGDPAHNVSYWGASGFAAANGLSLPAFEQYEALFQGKYPWGDLWDKRRTATLDNKFANEDGLYSFGLAEASSRQDGPRFDHLMGNVKEYSLATLVEVKGRKVLKARIVGMSVLDMGEAFDLEDAIPTSLLWKPFSLTGFRCVCELPADLLEARTP